MPVAHGVVRSLVAGRRDRYLSRARFLSRFAAIATDARFVWLPLPTDTTTSVDASSNAATITHSQTVADRWQQMGTRGLAVNFSAGPNKWADVPDLAAYTFGNGAADSAFTLIALAQVTDTAAARVLIAKLNDNGGGTGGEWYWQIDSSDRLQMALWDRSASVSPNRTSDAAILQGVPKLFATTYDGTGGATAANGITLYQDGVVIASTASNNASYVAMENTTHTIEIGTFVNHAASFMRGNIGLLAICGGALSAQNLLAIKALCNEYFGLRL